VASVELRIIQGPDAGQSIELTGSVVIGRDPAADLVLGDDQVSRRHCRITSDGTVGTVEDLGSTNGTYVDDRLVAGSQALRAGARIALGNTVIEYALPLDVTRPRPIISNFEQQTRARPIPSPPALAGQPPAVAVAPPAAAAAAVPFPAGEPVPSGEVPAAARPPAPPAAAEVAWNGIEVYGLVREFPGGFRAVNEIYLQVNPGEIYGFLGPNGAGKSTTVHMLTTLLPPTGGTAHVAGYDLRSSPADVRASIGVALQEAALDPLLNAHEHMRLQCSMQGLPRSEWKRRGDELIERVGLTDAADRRAGGYSGGMKRRLDLALALVHRPRILFLDEPTTGLDPKSRGDLWEEVARLAREDGVTVFLTTQYLEEADVLAARIAIIDHGELVAEGTPAQLKAEIGVPTVEVIPENAAERRALGAALSRFGDPAVSAQGVAVQLAGGASALVDVVRVVDAAGLRVASLNLHAPSLDDVFLAKTGRSLEQQQQNAAPGGGPPGQPEPAAARR
jgi:ABC-2 type transport system ATP-binding protein